MVAAAATRPDTSADEAMARALLAEEVDRLQNVPDTAALRLRLGLAFNQGFGFDFNQVPPRSRPYHPKYQRRQYRQHRHRHSPVEDDYQTGGAYFDGGDGDDDHNLYQASLWNPTRAGAHAVGDSYEELLALDDTIVKRGIPASKLVECTATQVLDAKVRMEWYFQEKNILFAVGVSPRLQAVAALDGPCSICLDDFAAGDSVRRLPCLCAFHTGCVDRHLRDNTACPICRSQVE
jgi:hypothetical protein